MSRIDLVSYGLGIFISTMIIVHIYQSRNTEYNLNKNVIARTNAFFELTGLSWIFDDDRVGIYMTGVFEAKDKLKSYKKFQKFEITFLFFGMFSNSFTIYNYFN